MSLGAAGIGLGGRASKPKEMEKNKWVYTACKKREGNGNIAMTPWEEFFIISFRNFSVQSWLLPDEDVSLQFSLTPRRTSKERDVHLISQSAFQVDS